jgi:SAM-dependent methyltransferase
MRRVIQYILQRTANSLARRIAATLAASEDLANRVAYRVAVEGRLQPIDGRPPHERFHGISDDFWFWICTEGFRRHTQLQDLLPGVPDESVQLNFTGAAGDRVLLQGFRFYQLVGRLYRTHVGPLEDCGRVLDFGCGWGRIIRFFLRDLDPSRLCGVDPNADMIQFCKSTNRWCTFERTGTRPPTALLPESIDLIYAFSVFSHLPEPVHEEWLIELKRVLRPGGLLIATTRARDFIPYCAALRNDKRLPSLSSGIRTSALSFPDTAESLAAYDRGEYCFTLHRNEWGDCAIPKGYVMSRWAPHLTFVDYIDDPAQCPQNVIVMQK